MERNNSTNRAPDFRVLAAPIPYPLLSRQTFLSLETCLRELIPFARRYRAERKKKEKEKKRERIRRGGAPTAPAHRFLRSATRTEPRTRANAREKAPYRVSLEEQQQQEAEERCDIPESGGTSGRDVFANFSNGQDHAERVDGPAISERRQREEEEEDEEVKVGG